MAAGDSGSRLRQTFFDCFSSYTAAVSSLWSGVANNQGPRLAASEGSLSAEEKLLVLHSNCVPPEDLHPQGARGQVRIADTF